VAILSGRVGREHRSRSVQHRPHEMPMDNPGSSKPEQYVDSSPISFAANAFSLQGRVDDGTGAVETHFARSDKKSVVALRVCADCLLIENGRGLAAQSQPRTKGASPFEKWRGE